MIEEVMKLLTGTPVEPEEEAAAFEAIATREPAALRQLSEHLVGRFWVKFNLSTLAVVTHASQLHHLLPAKAYAFNMKNLARLQGLHYCFDCSVHFLSPPELLTPTAHKSKPLDPLF